MPRPQLTRAQRMRELADRIDRISEADRKYECIAREGVR
jgi:hypothetical protein